MIGIDIEKLKSQTNIIEVIGRHVDLKKKGSNYVGHCPFHEDEKESLIVSESKQIFNCFACGGPTGKAGDSIDFLQGLGLSFQEACTEIAEGISMVLPSNTPEKKQSNETVWKYVKDAPQQTPLFNHYKYGKPNQTWAYRDINGNIVGYVCRFNLADGEKAVLPFSYATNGELNQWRWMGMDTPRPLYNGHLLSKYTKATILIVEGEKTADAAQNQLKPEKTIVVTWIGGANGIHNSDWTILKGRKIIYWPDNDYLQKYESKHSKSGEIKPWHEQAGNNAMLQIYSLLRNQSTVHRWVNGSKDLPNKWDAADKEWKLGEMRKYILDNLSEVPSLPLPEPEKKPEKESKKNEFLPIKNTEKPKKIAKNPVENAYYRMLGYDKDESGKLVYYFFSHDAKAVIKLSPSSITKSNLIPIAPLNYWEKNFPNKKSIDIDQVQQFLIGQSHKVGIFNDKYIRGRGAWIDEENIIVHAGNRILKKGEYIPLRDFKSKFVYEIGEDLGFEYEDPLRSIESKQLIDKMQWLLWERPVNAYLLAGWCVIAPFCGVLKWRPHIWITGPAGSGKSWTMEKMVKSLMLNAAVVVQGKTTEAGIRGMLQSDARPVLFDESDVDGKSDKERIQANLALARASSYSDGGGVVKGTQSGLSRTYTIRSCFAFASIGMQLNQQSDRSRFTILGLRNFENFRTKEEFAKFELDWNKIVNPKWIKRLHTRTINLLPIILENSKMFADAASHVIGNRRIGDQIGGMLAGAYSLFSSKKITYEDALKWVEEKDWSEEKGLESTKDEHQLFRTIMGYMVRIDRDGMTVDRTVGELISDAINGSISADERLRRLGIMAKKEFIYISNNTSAGISSILKNTPWSNNHSRILERLSGAAKISARRFHPGHKSRCISIPIEMILDKNEDDNLEIGDVESGELPF